MAPPEGFIYAENVVAAELWAELEAWLGSDASVPWEVATEGRRVAQWGFRYDYSSHSVDETPVAPIPPLLRRLLAGQAEPSQQRFTQCIVNEYVAGDTDGVPFHKDDAGFGDTVLVFTFGSPRTLCLRRLAAGAVAAQAPGDQEAEGEVEESFRFVPAHLSTYTLAGPARHDWQHSVLPGGASGDAEAGVRYSITFREKTLLGSL